MKEFTLSFDGWQNRRKRLCHDWLKNELLSILLDASGVSDLDEIMTVDEWKGRLERWERGLGQAMELIFSSATALSPARFLEHRSWLRLDSQERHEAGRLLEDEWWRTRGMAAKMDRALSAANSGESARSQASALLAVEGCSSPRLRESLDALRSSVEELNVALKEFEFSPIWTDLPKVTP